MKSLNSMRIDGRTAGILGGPNVEIYCVETQVVDEGRHLTILKEIDPGTR